MNRILISAAFALAFCAPGFAHVSKSTVALMAAWQSAYVDCHDGASDSPETNKACARQAPLSAALRARGCLLRQYER